jgi:hypothetical protein
MNQFSENINDLNSFTAGSAVMEFMSAYFHGNSNEYRPMRSLLEFLLFGIITLVKRLWTILRVRPLKEIKKVLALFSRPTLIASRNLLKSIILHFYINLSSIIYSSTLPIRS